VFASFERNNVHGQVLAKLSDDCTRIAAFARRIARAEHAPLEQIDQAFFAGMLCEIGVLVLLANRRDDYARVLERVRARPELDLEQIEIEELGASHSDVGAYLLGLWGLPSAIVESVAFHHHPSRASITTPGTSTYVHAAVAIQRGLEAGDASVEARHLDAQFVERLGLTARVDAWRSACSGMLEESE
jgi:HD-like signal output (HDOD) protein